MQSYAGTAHPRLPNRWEIVGPLGFVGFAWCDFVETMAAHAVRVIAETRSRGTQVAEVGQDAFDRWNSGDGAPRQDRPPVLHRLQPRTEHLLRQLPTRHRLPPPPNHHRAHGGSRGAVALTDYQFTRRSAHLAERGNYRRSNPHDRHRQATGRTRRLRHGSRSRTRPIALRAAGQGRRRRRRDRRMRSGRGEQRIRACHAGGPRRDGESRRGRGAQDPGQGGRRPRRRRPAAGGRRSRSNSSDDSTSWWPTQAC